MGIGWSPSYYAGAEVKCVIRYGGYDLIEVQDVEYSVNRNATPGGAGLGHPRNRYHKLGVPEGEFKISKNWLNAGSQADLFAQLIAGTTAIVVEEYTAGATHTCASPIVGVLYITTADEDGNTVVLAEGTDYLVDYTNNGIEFVVEPTLDGNVVYITDAEDLADDPMNGVNHPFVFDVEWRERDSGTVLKRLRGCMPYELSSSSGENEEAFTEDLSGQFLAYESRGVGVGILADGVSDGGQES